jgi:DNA-binding NtrC family response regulator
MELNTTLTPKVLWISNHASDVIDRFRVSLKQVDGFLDGLEVLRDADYDVVLVSFPLPDWTVAGLLEELRQAQPGPPIVIHAPQASATEVARWTRLGAFHVLTHSDPNSLLYFAAKSKWAAESAARTNEIEQEPWRRLLVGQSHAVEEIAERIRLVARRRTTVLITGETGTGKEVVARSIHAASDRSHLPMVSVNCGALPETLLEAELFGHVKGAFTGATNHRIGRFEQAHRGTIFLDEIGDMPLSLQAKFLRVLQEREFQRLGSSETIHVDVRVIAATHADLDGLIEDGKFRSDLYYRLNVVPIRIPPLRERCSDVRFLALHFIAKTCKEEGIAPKQISRDTLDRLAGHDWPGNVRQLENTVEQAVVMSGDRACLYPSDFALPARRHAMPFPAPGRSPSGEQPFVAVPDQGLDFERTVGTIELNILEQALKKTGGNKKLAAEMLGLKRTTLSAKLRSLAAANAPG